MANRYWVGGTGSWDGTAGTKWAATSGGTGGASVPTTADDVFFDAGSNGGGGTTVTIATGNTGAKSINCTGFTRTLTGTAAITVAGSVTLVAGMTYTHTGTVTFTGTGTLTTAGKNFSGVTVDGAGITLTLGDALNTNGRAITVTQGTFATANFSVTFGGGDFNSSGTATRAIQLGSSTLTLAGNAPFNISGSNLTFNAGTSQINHTSITASLNASISLTFYNYSFTGASAGARSITAGHTFNNLTLAATGAGLAELVLSADQTVNATLTCAGSSALNRAFVRSNTIGTSRTITAAAISANDCDFRDITLAGAAAGASPTRAGDCGGNSGITFPAAKTTYRVGTNTTWAGSASWALTSGGAGSNNNFPLAQDTAVINNSTALTGTLALAAYNIGALDCASRTTGITLNYNAAGTWHGSHALGSGVTVSGASNQTFSGRGTMDFTSAGKTITFPITMTAPSGTLRLADAFLSSNEVYVEGGTLNANNFNFTALRLRRSNSNLSTTVTMGSGLWTLTGSGIGTASPWNLGQNSGNLTIDKNTANILLSDNTTSARRFSGGAFSFNKLTIGGNTSTSTTTIDGSSSFTELASTKTVAHTVQLNGSLSTVDTWTITGSVGNVVTLNSSSAGTRRTFTLTNITSGIDYLAVQDIGELNANKFYVGANSTNNGNNSNVYFTAPPAPLASGSMFMFF